MSNEKSNDYSNIRISGGLPRWTSQVDFLIGCKSQSRLPIATGKSHGQEPGGLQSQGSS